jgi:hypothetical protein
MLHAYVESSKFQVIGLAWLRIEGMIFLAVGEVNTLAITISYRNQPYSYWGTAIFWKNFVSCLAGQLIFSDFFLEMIPCLQRLKNFHLDKKSQPHCLR